MSDLKVKIAQRKVTRYLLNDSHQVGGSKAKFFLSHGFSVNDPDRLAIALLEHGYKNWPGMLVPSTYGDRHEIVAPFACPDGHVRDLLTVWEIPHGETEAGFVTAYPQ